MEQEKNETAVSNEVIKETLTKAAYKPGAFNERLWEKIYSTKKNDEAINRILGTELRSCFSDLINGSRVNYSGVRYRLEQIEDMRMSMGVSPFFIIKNGYVIRGAFSLQSKALIAAFHNSGKFEGIYYERGEDEEKGQWSQAYTYNKALLNKFIGTTANDLSVDDLARLKDMAKVVGGKAWLNRLRTKSGAWDTAPDVMLDYRAATYLIRAAFPDSTPYTTEEARDIPHYQAARKVAPKRRVEVENVQAS